MFKSGPPAPEDPILRDAINRFASYIAASGPQAEELERKRNFENPRMAFLFDGEGATYYQFRLALEINNLKQMAQKPPPTPLSEIRVPPPQSAPMPDTPSKPDPEIDPIEVQIKNYKKQINESEKNLKAHYDAMQDTKKNQTDTLYKKRETERIYTLLDRVGINYTSFVKLIDHLAVSASKETISKCKHWIFNNCDTDQKREIILSYLLHRCRTDESGGSLLLHILYLINDWAYYCQRQKLDNIRQMLSRYAPKMYAHATNTSKIADKLDRLIGVWEGGKYFDENCYKQLLNAPNVLESEMTIIESEKSKIGEEVEKELRQTYTNYQKQHQEYERHILAQITSLQNQIAKIQEVRAERNRLQSAQYEERLIPKTPYYELPAGMLVPLVKPEDVTFEPIDPSKLRLPAPNLLTDRLKSQVERFYTTLHSLNMERLDNEGWETKDLAEHYDVKDQHKQKLIEKLQAEGKTFEDAITNRLTETLEQDTILDSPSKRNRRSSSGSNPSSSSLSDSPSSSSSCSSSPKPVFSNRSASSSPDARISFKGGAPVESKTSVAFVKSSSSTDESGVFKVPSLPLHREGNKGAQLLQKMGWSGGDLGTSEQGREEAASVYLTRQPQDQFKGIGSKSDEYDEYRKRMSHNKWPPNSSF